MPDTDVQWIVVTDLDGTLLNHDDYSFDTAKSAIAALQAKGIPVVLNTSKTYAETVAIRQQLGLNDAFVVENGSCLYLPKDRFEQPDTATSRDSYWELVLGVSHLHIEEVLEQLEMCEQHCIRLSRCSVEQAVELTGLTHEQAGQAIVREFSEPLIWQGSDENMLTLQSHLDKFGMTTLQGGRFLHIIGACDKGQATSRLAELYRRPVKVVALGDSANDAAMLLAADISIIVASPSNHQLRTMVTPDIQTESTAPDGWKQGIEKALERM